MPKNYSRKTNRKGFTLVELIVTIVILGILMAVAIPSMVGYYKKMEMTKANDSARQIYAAVQNQLTASKANGQLKKAGLIDAWSLERVPEGSASQNAGTSQITYYYMNTEHAVGFLNQGGQRLDDELVSPQASILIELDPENGSVFGVFFASYSDGNSTPFSYEKEGKWGLRGAGEDFCSSDEERSRGRARIGYYGGAAAKLEYESSLKTPMLEVENGEELIVRLTSFGQPAEFDGYLIKLEGEKGASYEYRISKEQLAADASGAILTCNSYNILLDSLAEGYTFREILERDFLKKDTDSLDPGETLTITAAAVGSGENRSFGNREEVSSLFEEKREETERTVITVSNSRHLQNLDAISNHTGWNKKGNVVRQTQDIDWNTTAAYYNGLAAEGISVKDKVSNATPDRAMAGGNDEAAFTPVASGDYDFTAAAEWGESLKDTTQTGYKIKNLKITGEENTGLFGEFSGSMSDITLVNPRVSGTGNVGALAGSYTAQDFGKIQNCKVYLDPDEDPSQAVFAYDDYEVSGGRESTGGLIGLVKKGEITGSFAAISVKGRRGAAGGFAGDLRNVRVEGCYASGQVSGNENTALGGFAGSCTENTEIRRCYAAGDLTSAGSLAGSFLGQYEEENGSVKIRASYAVGSQKARQEEGITALPFTGSREAEVGEDCYYLGKETSCGAIGLNLAQLTGTAVVKDARTLNQILREGWRYPSQYGTGTPVSERTRLTHPYYRNGRLTEADSVYPYPALDFSVEELSVPIAHYGDWAPDMTEEGDNLQLFYYEKYGDSDYGYYFKDRSFSVGLDATKPILETGYGVMVPEENAAAPAMARIKGYYNGEADQSLGELKFTPIEDFYQVIGGVHYYGMKIEGSGMRGTGAGEKSWQSIMSGSYRTEMPLNYISFHYSGKLFYFNPCFAKAMGSILQEEDKAPAWFGSRTDAFMIRTEGQLKCIDGFGEYRSTDGSYFFVQEREQITLSTGAWIPLCPNGFFGSYEGNGCTIQGLVIQGSSWVTTKTNLGLFDTVGSDAGETGSSTIRNLTVETADAGYQKAIQTSQAPDQGDVYFGILAGKCRKNSWIENCNTVLNASIQFVNGNAQSDFTKQYYRTYIGGLVGYSNGVIRGCQVWGDGEIEATRNQEVCAGGFAGFLDQYASVQTGGTGIQCLTNTNVRVNGFAAGFVAENKGSISNAYSGGMVEGKQLYNAGFLVINHPDARIENCSSGISTDEPIFVRQSGDTGKNSSSSGFVAVNGGTILNSRVYARVETTGSYASGFVLENCGKISGCDAVVSVFNTNNTTVGFVRQNVFEIDTIPNDKNSRKETFIGKEKITNCNVYSLYEDRNTVNLFSAWYAAGFADISSNEISYCSVKSNIEVENPDRHITGAGFILTNNGYILNSYSNSILTVKTAGENRDAKAAGFAFKNNAVIDSSYADCITAAKSDHSAKAAGFVLETGTAETGVADVISNCYALLEVKAEGYTSGVTPAISQVSGFVLSNNKNVDISNCYSASELDGTQKYGFGPAGLNVENCYYLSFSGNMGAAGCGTPLTESGLHTLNMGFLWETGTVDTTHPNSPALSQMAYPYPKLWGLDHYGDWVEVVEHDGTVFYYEKYADNDYGIYLMVNNYRAYSTLSETEDILDWGYGILVEGELRQKGSMTVFSRNSAGQSTQVENNNISAWLDGKELKGDQPFGSSYHLYPFKEQKQNTLLEKVKDASIQYLYTKVDATDTYNFFNPCFAAAVNVKSYASADSARMPDASFGMEGEPFKIRHADHFYYMGNKGYESRGSRYRYFEQTRTIDLQDQAATRIWNPWDSRYKGSQGNGQYLRENPYIGEYNGNGFEIRGYRLPASTNAQYVGLFGYLGDESGEGSVRGVSLKVTEASMSLGNCQAAGLLAAYVAAGSKIQDCSVDIGQNTIRFTNTVAMAGGAAGGSAGSISGTRIFGKGTIYVSRNGNIQIKIGGFTAENKGIIESCEMEGVSVEANANFCYAAGFTAYNYGAVRNSSISSAQVISAQRTAAGFVMENGGEVISCKASDLYVKGKWTAAGFVYNNGHDNAGTEFDGLTNSSPVLDGDYTSVRIGSCSFEGTVVSTQTEACGFARYNFGTITDSAASGEVTFGTGNDGTEVYTDKGGSGFCQTNLGTISGACSTNAKVTGLSFNAYGAGFVINNYGTIQGSAKVLIEASGTVVSKKAAAGFVVFNTGTVDYAAYTGALVDTASAGNRVQAAGFAVENGSGKKTSARILHSRAGGKEALSIRGDADSAGFVVKNSGGVEGCSADGIELVNNSGKDHNAAGFVCINSTTGTIGKSSAQGQLKKPVSGEKGTAGFAASNEGEISNQCTASVNITTNEDAAGFVGVNEAGGIICGTSLIPVRVFGKGLVIQASDGNSAGFAVTNRGTIEYTSVELEGGRIESGGTEGAGFIWNNEKIVRSSHMTSALISGKEAVSGFAARNRNGAVIQNASVGQQALLSAGKVYGFIRENEGSIIGGNVFPELSGDTVNGFAGINRSKAAITKSLVQSPSVTGAELAVGFAGLNEGEITDSRVEIFGEIKGADAYGFLETNAKGGRVTDAVVTGEALRAAQNAAGFARVNNGTIEAVNTGTCAQLKVSSSEGTASGFLDTNGESGKIAGSAAYQDKEALFVAFSGASAAGEAEHSDAFGFVQENQGSISYAAAESEEGVSAGRFAAGFAGNNDGVIAASFVKGNTASENRDAAGFALKNKKEIRQSYADGSILGGIGQGASASGFVMESSGEITDSFAVCEIQGRSDANGMTAGFVTDAAGSIRNSYSISSLSAGVAESFAFEASGEQIENCYYLDWEGTAGTASGRALPKSEEELRKLADAGGALPAEIWQANYSDPERPYTYPSITGLPLPRGDLKGSAAYGVFYYELTAGQYQFYQVDWEGTVQDGLRSETSEPEETGYGIYQLEDMEEKPVMTQNGARIPEGQLLQTEGAYRYLKLPETVSAKTPLKLESGGQTSYFYMDLKFAEAIEYVQADGSGAVPDSKLGNKDGIPLAVRTAGQLMEIKGEYLAKAFVQQRDIALGEASFEPIGGSDGSGTFSGRYDGGGYNITKLSIAKDCKGKDSYLGLFGKNSGELLDIHVEGKISTTGDPANGYVGGLAGSNLENGRITLCSAGVDIKNAGFTGWGKSWVGGFAGSSQGVIESSYASGDVENGNYVGGFVGILVKATGGQAAGVSDSYCTGNAVKSGGGSPGQFAGQGGLVSAVRCYAYNAALHKGAAVYKMAGNGVLDAMSCYYLGNTNGGTENQKQLTAEEMSQETFYVGFEFGTTWMMNSGDNGYVSGFLCPQLAENPQRYGTVSYALEIPGSSADGKETEAAGKEGNNAEKETKSTEKEEKAAVNAVPSTEKETKGSEKAAAAEKETKSTEKAAAPEKETKTSEKATAASEKETKAKETAPAATEKETKATEQETKNSEKETAASEQDTKGAEKETKARFLVVGAGFLECA